MERNWVTPEQIAQARQMDIITYLNRYEPGELVHIRGDVYSTKTHDSLKISERTGKWKRWSTGDGGHTALDFLTDVRGMNFQDAVRLLAGQEYSLPARAQRSQPQEPKQFILPVRHTDNERLTAYLMARGISKRLVDFCISAGKLYEDAKHHNCVFVGTDRGGIPHNAFMRSTGSNSTFLREVDGSDKRFSFKIITTANSSKVYLFESCIDLLSYLSLAAMRNENVRGANFLSLNGIYSSRDGPEQTKPPQALEQYLADYPDTKVLHLCLDNDFAGRKCAKLLHDLYSSRYSVIPDLPKEKDYNAQLMAAKGISVHIKTRGENAYER